MRVKNLLLNDIAVISLFSMALVFAFAYPKLLSNSVPKTEILTLSTIKSIPVQDKNTVSLPLIPPKLKFSVKPDYPVEAVEKGLEGTVLLSLSVSSNGNVKEVLIKSSSGSLLLDESAKIAAAKWQFNPAKRGPQTVNSRFEVPVRFSLK